MLVTRRTPLAVVQAELVCEYLKKQLPHLTFAIIKLVTTGDRRLDWSLEKKQGRGLFTKELEEALLEGRADIAVHSAKDLPTELPKGLAVAGYLPRGPVGDVLVMREGVGVRSIATGSARRRMQLAKLFPSVDWLGIRGKIETRLNKIADGYADATVVAEAALERLGITEWPGVRLQKLTMEEMVPAVGQGAILVEVRKEKKDFFAPFLDLETFSRVSVERLFLALLQKGCQSAFAVHCTEDRLYLFDESFGWKVLPFVIGKEASEVERMKRVQEVLKENIDLFLPEITFKNKS